MRCLLYRLFCREEQVAKVYLTDCPDDFMAPFESGGEGVLFEAMQALVRGKVAITRVELVGAQQSSAPCYLDDTTCLIPWPLLFHSA